MSGAGNGVTHADVMKRIDDMAKWARMIEDKLDGVNVSELWAEADELAGQYSDVPEAIRLLEQRKAGLESHLTMLKDKYELIDAQAMLDCIESNKEKREAEKTLTLANNEQARELMTQIRDVELEIKVVGADIQEKEKVWSDYHRKVMILASKAGVSYR